VANRDEEIEHFDIQCREYRSHSMFDEVAEELDRLNASLHNYYQFRNTEAVNRLGMLSMILGVGAVATGFFGMNFNLGDVSEGILHATAARNRSRGRIGKTRLMSAPREDPLQPFVIP
jgi:hypothetical protein